MVHTDWETFTTFLNIIVCLAALKVKRERREPAMNSLKVVVGSVVGKVQPNIINGNVLL